LESELVGGFFTEHSSVPFVFFFLGEYSSIVLFSSLTSILFLGGYNFIFPFFDLLSSQFNFAVATDNVTDNLMLQPLSDINNSFTISNFVHNVLSIFSFSALFLGIKTCLICFMFVLARATFPRIRYDKLMNFCWLNLLPLVVSLIILVPCILICLNYFNEYYLYFSYASVV
jgi:NADH-ubiquinone oxidoreductase chain 1